MSDERKETKKMYVWKSAQLQNKIFLQKNWAYFEYTNGESNTFGGNMTCVTRKLLLANTDGSIRLITHDWNSNEDKWTQLKCIPEGHAFQVAVTLEIIQGLVKMAALHDDWVISDIQLFLDYKTKEEELKKIIQKIKENRGYYVLLFDGLSALSAPLAVKSLTITNKTGDSIYLCANGEIAETGDTKEMEKAVKETVLQYLSGVHAAPAVNEPAEQVHAEDICIHCEMYNSEECALSPCDKVKKLCGWK